MDLHSLTQSVRTGSLICIILYDFQLQDQFRKFDYSSGLPDVSFRHLYTLWDFLSCPEARSKCLFSCSLS